MTGGKSGAEHAWWRNSAVYQVYVRSFADGNGDGTGDIAGLRNRLDYIRDLGVDAIWVNPWYESPLHDGGYDVSDYRKIDERFGSLSEAEQFIAEAHDRGIRVIVDIVPNHTSSAHPWFAEALASTADSPSRDRYIFREGSGPDGSLPPNDWTSVFGGSAWERVDDGQWYLHLFDVEQPDLNWNNDEVRKEFTEIFRFWLERGADGFRVDVAHALIKHPDFPNSGGRSTPSDRSMLLDHPHWDRDELHEIARDWRTTLDEYDDRMMIAEAWVAPSRLPAYLRPDEYHQSFNFDLLEADWNAEGFGDVITTSLDAAADVGALPTWVLSNHDVMRHATRYGLPEGTDWRLWPATGPHLALDAEAGARRARAAGLITMALPGSVYVYQGEELGLPDVWDLPEDVLDDPTWRRSGHTERGRDGCRVPIPWEASGPSFGFGALEAWLPQPDWFSDYAVERQLGDSASTLQLYRSALLLRKNIFADNEVFAMLDLGPHVLAFQRGHGMVCVTNMGPDPIPLPQGRIVLSSQPISESTLPPDTSAWLSSTSRTPSAGEAGSETRTGR